MDLFFLPAPSEAHHTGFGRLGESHLQQWKTEKFTEVTPNFPDDISPRTLLTFRSFNNSLRYLELSLVYSPE